MMKKDAKLNYVRLLINNEKNNPNNSLNYWSTDCYAKIIAIQGLLYSFDNENPHENSGSVYQNGSWQKLHSVVPLEPNTSAPIPVYIIPYYVRTFWNIKTEFLNSQ